MLTVAGLIQIASEPDKNLLISYGLIALVALVLLGLRFLVSMFEVITAPTASLRHHGHQNNFFQSVLIVFVGGAIGTLILLLNQGKLVAAWQEYSSELARNLALTNSNQNYQQIAEDWARGKLDANFSTFAVDNLIWLPILLVGLWLVIGIITYFFAKIMGGHATAAGFLGALAYGCFFINIGIGLLGVSIVSFLAAQIKQGSPAIDPMAIAGAVLLLYGLVLWLIAANTAAENTGGQTIGVMIFLLVILGGTVFGLQSQVFQPKFDAFSSAVQGLDPSRGQQIPQ